MTDDITDRARAALEGVTEGPWEPFLLTHDTSYPSDTYHVITARTGDMVAEVDNESRSYEEPHAEFGRDARFISAARSLVPELLAEVERLRAEHDPAHCYHCTRCADADDSQREGYKRSQAEIELEGCARQAGGEIPRFRLLRRGQLLCRRSDRGRAAR